MRDFSSSREQWNWTWWWSVSIVSKGSQWGWYEKDGVGWVPLAFPYEEQQQQQECRGHKLSFGWNKRGSSRNRMQQVSVLEFVVMVMASRFNLLNLCDYWVRIEEKSRWRYFMMHGDLVSIVVCTPSIAARLQVAHRQPAVQDILIISHTIFICFRARVQTEDLRQIPLRAHSWYNGSSKAKLRYGQAWVRLQQLLCCSTRWKMVTSSLCIDAEVKARPNENESRKAILDGHRVVFVIELECWRNKQGLDSLCFSATYIEQ